MIISMINRTAGADWVVRLGVTRSGGWRDWGAVSGQFERHLAAQASERIVEPHIDSESRRGSDHVRITVLMNVRAADVAEALSAAWWAFRKAADDGWDLSTAVAEVRPGEALAARAHHASPQCPLMDGSFDGIHASGRRREIIADTYLPKSDSVGELRAHGPCRPLGLAAGSGRVRAACAWSAACGYRDRSAPAVRQQRGRFPLRGRPAPVNRGPATTKGKTTTLSRPIKPAADPPGSQPSGQTPE